MVQSLPLFDIPCYILDYYGLYHNDSHRSCSYYLKAPFVVLKKNHRILLGIKPCIRLLYSDVLVETYFKSLVSTKKTQN